MTWGAFRELFPRLFFLVFFFFGLPTDNDGKKSELTLLSEWVRKQSKLDTRVVRQEGPLVHTRVRSPPWVPAWLLFGVIRPEFRVTDLAAVVAWDRKR